MIRWPGMKHVDCQYTKKMGIPDLAKGEAKVQWMGIVDGLWVAPKWIAWLYRILPNHANINLTRWRTEPAYYQANIGAPTWVVAIAMRRGIPAIHCWFGRADHGYYLPWGVRLYAKWTSPVK